MTPALPGTTVTFSAGASDNVGVSLVRFTVDDGAPTDVAGAPFERQVVLPAVAAPDQQVVVKATAYDAAGNSASALASHTVRVVPDTTGAGYKAYYSDHFAGLVRGSCNQWQTRWYAGSFCCLRGNFSQDAGRGDQVW